MVSLLMRLRYIPSFTGGVHRYKLPLPFSHQASTLQDTLRNKEKAVNVFSTERHNGELHTFSVLFSILEGLD